MAYVGNPIDTQNTFQSLQGKRFNGDGSTTDFTLDVAPSSTLDIEVFVGNVRQDPNSAYTLSGTTLTFTGAPPSGTNNIYVVHQAKSVGTIDVPDDIISGKTLVTADSSADHVLIEDATDGGLKKALYPSGFSVSSITGATELAAQPAATDEIVLSDAGTLKRLDIKHISNTPAFMATLSGDQTLSDNTETKLAFATEVLDSDGKYDHSTNYRFTPTIAGRYLVCLTVFLDSNNAGSLVNAGAILYKNGSGIHYAYHSDHDSTGRYASPSLQAIVTLDSDDYIEAYGICDVDGSGTAKAEGATNNMFSAFRLTGLES